jgi:hypothetical protein
MSADAITRIEKLRGQRFSEEEAVRLREIGGALNLRDDDAVWNLLAALEYQRVYYEALPQKIAVASTEILQGISIAAEKEAGRAQSLLAERVAGLAEKMSLRVNIETLLPMGLVALVCLLIYGSLLMWAGICLGSGRAHPPEWLLRVPSGFLMAGLCAAGGLFMGVYTGREFAEDAKGWRKKGLIALAMLVSGSVVLGLTLS